ncbi:MAG: hypothetical protein L6Q98_19735 [Anaerolineae bacterium]|nr:hypothetical protein [Anaerolineae bacterium]NUQ04682.1 hypothetical protein [Anaerolineae bacterium]
MSTANQSEIGRKPPKKGGLKQWFNQFLGLYLVGLIGCAVIISRLSSNGGAQVIIAALAVIVFPIIYLLMTAIVLPLARRQFKTVAQRTAVTVVLIVLAVVFFSVLPVLFPFVGFVVLVWIFGKSSSGNGKPADEYTEAMAIRDKLNQTRAQNNEPPV